MRTRRIEGFAERVEESIIRSGLSKSEIIIKSAADLAMRLKPDGEEVDLEDMLMAFDKALKEMDGEDV